MKKLALSALAASTLLFGAAYKLPENSLNGTALSAAYVANAHGADASYYNPAAMAFESRHALEFDATYVGLTPVDFYGNVGEIEMDGSSESEAYILPTLHYISPKLGDVTLGLSVVVPGGLSKRWEIQPAQSYAREFTLQVVEINPTVAYKINDVLAIGGGLRLVQSKGVVKSQSTASRDLSGDSIDFGYNLALSYKPSERFDIAATYRSNVDLTEVGTAKLYFPDSADYSGNKVYDGDAEVAVPLPATVALALAYHTQNGTTIEFVYERNFWSAYKELDFEYESSIGVLTPTFDDPISKKWNDTNTFRLGLTQEYEAWTAMAGIAYDESPVPKESLNFELPDSSAWIYSLGGRYKVDSQWSVGVAGLIDIKESRNINHSDIDIDGDFSNGRAYLLTLGVEYTF